MSLDPLFPLTYLGLVKLYSEEYPIYGSWKFYVTHKGDSN